MNMKNKLASGEFLILAEMEPPKGVDFCFRDHSMPCR